MSDHDRLRQLAQEATPGPWEAMPRLGGQCAVWGDGNPIAWEQDDMHEGVFNDTDAEFIAAANPTVVLALLDEIERLRGKHTPSLSCRCEFGWAQDCPHHGDDAYRGRETI